MGLKASLTSKADLDSLAEPLRALYVERDGKYVLDAEGLVPATEVGDLKTKLGEFRDNNRTMHTELETLRPLKDKYKDVDVDEYQTLKTEREKLNKKGVKGADDLDAAITAAVTLATKPLADKLAAEEQARIAAQKQADNARFRELVTADATKAGVTPKSLRHVLREAEEKFELKDGQLTPRAGVKHPTEPLKDLTPVDWLQDLAKSDEYLFAPSSGSGTETIVGGVRVPAGAKTLLNPTPEQMGAAMDDIATGKVVVVRQ